MLIRRRMTRDVVTVSSTATVADALDMLNAHTIRHLPVVDGGKVVGIVTASDLLRSYVERLGYAAASPTLEEPPE